MICVWLIVMNTTVKGFNSDGIVAILVAALHLYCSVDVFDTGVTAGLFGPAGKLVLSGKDHALKVANCYQNVPTVN